MKNDNYQGFTFIESLLVLSIIIIMSGLPLLLYHDWQQKISHQQFFLTLENYYHRAQLAAVYANTPTFIYVNGQEDIVIYLKNYDRQTQVATLPVPKKITCKNKVTLQFKGKSGNISELTSFSFTDNQQKIRVEYRVQLGSGKLVKEITAL